MNKSTLAVAALMLTASLAAPDALADRKFREPNNIMISPVADGVSSIISVDPALSHPTEGVMLDLSGDVTIFVNDVPIIVARYIYDVRGSISSGCVPNFCDGFCPDPSAFCNPGHPGYPCACYVGTERISSPPIVLHAGDVITASIVAIPGAEPEDYTGNDTISMVFGPACAADYNTDGTRDVSDIFGFLTDWFAGVPAAYNFGGTPGVPAIFAFLNAWFDGCPA